MDPKKVYRRIFSLFIILSLTLPLYAQTPGMNNGQSFSTKTSNQRYVTDEKGNILMYVNVWGHVKRPGNILVYDGIDLASVLSMVGGPNRGAKYESLLLIRDIPDDAGQTKYVIDLEKFIKEGDKGNFVEIMPNDTIIVSQTKASYILSNVGFINTILQMMNLYINITR
jgi:hypothetical protein